MSDDTELEKVTLARGLLFHEAETFQRELEMHGIASWILDTSHTEQIAAPGLAPMGRLMVRPADQKKAQQILADFEKRPAADSSPDDKAWRAENERDATASRSMRAAILGLLCAPYLAQLYSFFLLMALRPHYGELPRKTRRKMWAAAVIDVAAFLAASAGAWWAGHKFLSGLLIALPVVLWWFGAAMSAAKSAKA
ncbi:MAG TPA: hypothetical protein PLI95_03855 [Polyangiaceae bacterium]|nr:hypothetical protein [Polyangiaceae bacterium]